MQLTADKISAILAGLRLLQRIPSNEREQMEHFAECQSLSNEQIDALCEELNCAPEDAVDLDRSQVIALAKASGIPLRNEDKPDQGCTVRPLLMDEIIRFANVCAAAGTSALSAEQQFFIDTTLANDEASTDEELVEHFMGELGISEAQARAQVARRDAVLLEILGSVGRRLAGSAGA